MDDLNNLESVGSVPDKADDAGKSNVGDASPMEPAVAEPVRQSCRFTGSGGEYFRIWIVNLFLSILTLGIYSAWAKVRRMQYFYRHTELASASFDYHGNPRAILKGRLIALALLMTYSFSFQISVWLGVVTLIVLAGLLPRLLRNSLRFRMHNSSYRGLRFDFTGTIGEAYRTFLIGPIVAVVTLYLAVPWAHHRLKRYQHANSHYGQTPFHFSASSDQFYRVYLKVLRLMVLLFLIQAAIIVFMFFMIETVPQISDTTRQNVEVLAKVLGSIWLIVFALFLVASLFLKPLLLAWIQNLIWNHTTLGPHRFVSDIVASKLCWIYLTNFIGVLVTLGLFMPWAAVRLARYRVQALSLVSHGSLDDFITVQQQAADGATGEESAEMFDIDIAF